MDYLSDIIQNSVEANATVVIATFEERAMQARISVADNGRGMDSERLASVADPYSTEGDKHASRPVGLGLSFLSQTAQQCGGAFDVQSEPGTGTSVWCTFDLSNVDTPPIGDIPLTIASAMNLCGDAECVFTRKNESGSYTVRKSELEEAAGALTAANSLIMAREFIRSAEEDIHKGA